MDTKILLKLLEDQADPAFLAFKNQFSKRLKENFLNLS